LIFTFEFIYLCDNNYMYKTLKDLHLIGKYKNGDNMALSELVIRHKKGLSDFIYSLIKNKVDAEDTIQNVYIKIIDGINKNMHLNSKKANIKAWMMSIAYNSAMNFYKKNKNDIVPQCYSLDEFNLFENAPSVYYENEERVEILFESLLVSTKFTSDELKIIELRYRGKLKYKDIEKQMNMSAYLVRVIFKKAVWKLKNQYNKSIVNN